MGQFSSFMSAHIPTEKGAVFFRQAFISDMVFFWWNERGIPLCTVKYIIYLPHSWLGINCQLLYGVNAWLKLQLCSKDWKRPWKWQSKAQHSELTKQIWQERQLLFFWSAHHGKCHWKESQIEKIKNPFVTLSQNAAISYKYFKCL